MAACDSCGAALAVDADTCDLCGTPVGDPTTGIGADPPVQTCTSCGAHPPAGSQFCNRCGAALAAASPAAPTVEVDASRGSSDPGRRALVIAGVGALAVAGLWAATALTDPPAPEPVLPETPAVGEAAPIPEGAPPLPDSLQQAADRFAALDSAEGWYESGRYYLTAAFTSAQTDPTSSVRWARRAITDFERSLAIDDAPAVRVALAEAATFDPSDPMRPVQELRAVLDADPDNLDATVLLAERRLMIGRVDSARAGFERVRALAPEGSLARERADRGLAAIAQP